jgi:DNA polymerase-3 subunit epsilon
MGVFHRKEPRDLAAAVRFYLGREHEGAHGAEADVRASFEVLEAQLARYDDVPDTPEAIEAWLQPPALPGAADRTGKFVLRDGRPAFNFGKHRGRALADVASEAPDYLKWLLQGDFPEDAKALVREALGRRA